MTFCEDCDVTVFTNLKNRAFLRFGADCTHKDSNIRHFFEQCDYARNPNKEECDHMCNHIKTQKYDIFVSMIAVLKNSAFYEDCDHNHNSQK